MSIPEINIDTLMKHIREEIAKNRYQHNAILGLEARDEIPVQSESDSPSIDTSVIKSIVTAAEATADTGVEVTPMHHFRGLTRKIAVLIGRVIIYLSSFITDKQRRFNHTVIHALRTLTDTMERQHSTLSGVFSKKSDLDKLREHINILADKQAALRGSLSRIDAYEKMLEELSENIRNLNKTSDMLSGDQATLKRSIEMQDVHIQKISEEVKNLKPRPEKRADPLTDSFYLSFENTFRGTREDIEGRVAVYLPYINDARAGTEKHPVIDLGCGRGEWLEVLKKNNLKGLGVDNNKTMVAFCRKRGLDVIHGDCVNVLEKLLPDSIGAVTGFHIIEHLDFNIIMRLFQEAIRVLKPGGIVILETPNPQNILVGSYSFYMDPTHRKPLPSPLIRFLAEESGLTDIEVLHMHPSQEKPEDTGLDSPLNDHFYGPQDYAVIGHKKV